MDWRTVGTKNPGRCREMAITVVLNTWNIEQNILPVNSSTNNIQIVKLRDKFISFRHLMVTQAAKRNWALVYCAVNLVPRVNGLLSQR